MSSTKIAGLSVDGTDHDELKSVVAIHQYVHALRARIRQGLVTGPVFGPLESTRTTRTSNPRTPMSRRPSSSPSSLASPVASP